MTVSGRRAGGGSNRSSFRCPGSPGRSDVCRTGWTGLAWDMDENGEWAAQVKGVDDYLMDLEQKKTKPE